MPQTQRISRNNTTVICTSGLITVTLHATPVVHADKNKGVITFDNGGWITATTATRMNQACNEFGFPYSISRKQGVMVARHRVTGSEFPFTSSTLTLPL